MKNWKMFVWTAARLGALAMITGGLMTAPSVAQIRPAMVRDVDNGALDPQRIAIQVSLGANENFKTVLGPVVPAGKRLVVENVSVWALTADPAKVTGVWLKPLGVQTFLLLDPAANEFRPLGSGLTLAAYNRALKAYFNAGEQLEVNVFTDGTGSTKLVNLYIQGYYVTLP